MGRTPAEFVTASEFAVLEEIWKHESRTVRQLVDELYPTPTPSAVAIVQKLLYQLERKGIINRDRDVSPHVVSPVHNRKELAKIEFAALAKKYGMKPAEMAKL